MVVMAVLVTATRFGKTTSGGPLTRLDVRHGVDHRHKAGDDDIHTNPRQRNNTAEGRGTILALLLCPPHGYGSSP